MRAIKSLALLLLTTVTCMHCCACVPLDDDDDAAPPKDAAEKRVDPIPMEFYRELDDVDDISELIERFIDKDSIDPQLGLQDTHKRSVERALVVIPKAAHCSPENTIVPLTPLEPSKDPKVFYYPKCTRVKRCGGCCSSELMSCQPTESEVINFEITKLHYGDRAPVVGKEIVPVEAHTKCKCDCRIKAEDCNPYQVYRPELCRCECINDDSRTKCLQQDRKIWDEGACKCVCPDSQNCTTGTIFDESSCQCVHAESTTTAALLDRRRFILKAIPIETDNSTVYNF